MNVSTPPAEAASATDAQYIALFKLSPSRTPVPPTAQLLDSLLLSKAAVFALCADVLAASASSRAVSAVVLALCADVLAASASSRAVSAAALALCADVLAASASSRAVSAAVLALCADVLAASAFP